MKIYLAGPMSGIQFYNFPAFDAAAARLRALGHSVVSPADLDREHGFDGMSGDPAPFTHRDVMRWDLPAVLDADVVAVLPGWQASKGTAIELAVARGVGIPVLDAETLEAV